MSRGDLSPFLLHRYLSGLPTSTTVLAITFKLKQWLEIRSIRTWLSPGNQPGSSMLLIASPTLRTLIQSPDHHSAERQVVLQRLELYLQLSHLHQTTYICLCSCKFVYCPDVANDLKRNLLRGTTLKYLKQLHRQLVSLKFTISCLQHGGQVQVLYIINRTYVNVI